MINSELGRIFHRFQNTATYSLKLSIEACGQTAADGDIITIDQPQEFASALSDGRPTVADSYDLLFSHNTA